MTGKGDSIERLRDRITAGGAEQYYGGEKYEGHRISEADRGPLLEFSDRLRLLRSDYSDDRHQKLLNSLVLMAEHVGGLAAAVEDREAAEEIVRWIHRTYPTEETNKDYRIALRMFGKRVDTGSLETDDHGIPLALSWISSTTSKTYDPAPDPAKMLRWENEVQAMLDETLNERDSALISLAMDLGPRGGELYDINVGDITWFNPGDDDVDEEDWQMRVTVRGRRGQRTVEVIPCQPNVEDWLDEHPGRDEPTAPLWSKLESPEQVSYRMFLNIFKDVADRAGVTKTVTPTKFRKSSAAHLASNGINQAHLERHHGWVTGSKAAARYISVFSDRASKELHRVYATAPSTAGRLPVAIRGDQATATAAADTQTVQVDLEGATGNEQVTIVIQMPPRGSNS